MGWPTALCARRKSLARRRAVHAGGLRDDRDWARCQRIRRALTEELRQREQILAAIAAGDAASCATYAEQDFSLSAGASYRRQRHRQTPLLDTE